MAGHGRNVIVGAAAFVVAEEEDGVLPLRAGHEGIDDLRHFRLPEQDGLARSRVLVIDAVAGFNEAKLGSVPLVRSV